MIDVTDAISKYAVGGDDEMAICVLPNATVLIAAKEKKPLSQVSVALQQKLFKTANEIAILAYEALQAHGTNVISYNANHAYYLVIARTEEDGIPLRWNPGKSSPKELADLAGKLKDAAWTIGKKDVTDANRPVVNESKPEALKPQENKSQDLERSDMHSPNDFSGRDLSDLAAEMQTRTHKGPHKETDYRIKNLTRRR